MAEIKRARDTTEFQGETGEPAGFVSTSDLFKRASVVQHVSSDVQEATSQWKLGIPAQEISNSSTAGSEISDCVDAGKRKRKSDSSEDEAALKPYECRFCPMKFAKSQALGGHMNRHRQEREREQLLHARQLVLQQGLPWVAGQNHKLQRSTSDCYNSRIASAPLPPSFHLSQSSLSWNISTLGSSHHQVLPDGGTSLSSTTATAAGQILPKCTIDEEDNSSNNFQLSMPRGTPPPPPHPPPPPSYCSQSDVPYMVQQHAHATTIRASFPAPGGGGGSNPNDMLLIEPPDMPASMDSYDPEEQPNQHATGNADELTPATALHVQQHESCSSEFPSLQLGPCSSDQMISEVSPLHHMAVDFPQQLLSLGGYGNNQGGLSSALDGYRGGSHYLADMLAGPTVPCDGLSWIFGNKAGSLSGAAAGGGAAAGNPVNCFVDGFSLALGHNTDDHHEHNPAEVEPDDDAETSRTSVVPATDADETSGAGVKPEAGASSSHLSLLNT